MSRNLLWRRMQAVPAPTEPAEPVAGPPIVAYRLLRAINPVFLIIMLGGALVRFYDLNWDQGTHIHPDERFLTMVGNAERLPSSLAQYLNPATSLMNPANVPVDSASKYTFFVYGTLPVTLNKFLAVWLGHDTYDAFTLQGRFLSALADLLVLPLIFGIVRLFQRHYGLRPQVPYLAMLFYAVAVMPIQLSHFFAVDSFMNLFAIASFFFALRYAFRPRWPDVVLSAIAFGAAIACKTSAVYILPLDAAFMALPFFPDLGQEIRTLPGWARALRPTRRLGESVLDAFWTLLVFALVAYVTVRLADPYMFQTGNLLDPQISTLFINNLKTLQGYNDPNAWFPPGVQWISKPPIIFALGNLAFFGIGLPFFLFVLMGAMLFSGRRSRVELFAIVLWVLVVFLFQSVQYTKNMRYFIIIYPFLAIFSANGFQTVTASLGSRRRGLVMIPILIWPLAFMSIYVHQHSRVQASEWIYQHIPNNSIILSESWDDPLPLYNVPNPQGKTFPGSLPLTRQLASYLGQPAGTTTLNLSMPVFDPDTPQKWRVMNYLLQHGDYLILSSNRGWGSITTVANRYPQTTAYYSRLLSGKLHYKLVKEFTSYPSLRYLGIPLTFDDSWSEESFTVYDHPVVMIFKHVR